MSEVTPEEQATMALKLADDVKDLIRNEIKAALDDSNFIHAVSLHHIAARIASYLKYDSDFQRHQRQALADHLKIL